jgi:hypothetical protein
MKLYIVAGMLLLAAGCKETPSNEAVIDARLIEAMSNHLTTTGKPGTAFTVKEVIYTEKNNEYYCEFRVNMKTNVQDTTGTMTAFISKDFKTVNRTQ